MTDQIPAPTYTQDTVVNSVIQQLIERSKVCLIKYGTTLDTNDLDLLDWIEHSKQEAMDFVLYLEKMKRVILDTTSASAVIDVIPTTQVDATTDCPTSMQEISIDTTPPLVLDQQIHCGDSTVIFRE